MREKEFKPDECVLITGGTGSFGNAVLRRLLESDVREIRIFSRDEKKQDDMRRQYRSPKLKFYIGDVRNMDSVQEAMTGVNYVFHAAALKQVPSCEFYPLEAIRTNSLGADNVLQAANQGGVGRVVVLSTDKAAYPINVMGLSKAMMEKRYGNVMASRGSVIPLFIEQIEAGQELTVTDPNMTRFMMTLEDAVDLVVYAFHHGEPGDLFVRKAPAATIGTLVEALTQLLGVKSKMRIIGSRHGEKQYETLLTREEMAKAKDQGNYYRIPADNRDLNYNLYFSEGDAHAAEVQDYHSHNTERLDVEGMTRELLRLPEIHETLARRGRKSP